MIFKRKIYNNLLAWKENYADKYSILLEGARRVGKSTIAENFAKNEYESYIFIDFASGSSNILKCFDDVSNPEMFFLRLQAETGINLVEGNSLIVFDEIQLFPRARQAIKYLIKYGKYHYLETGSLISIKKNVKDILIPSEEMKLQVYPLDYEEFLWATGISDYNILRQIYKSNKPIGQQTNRKLMRDLRIYMAVGGMPQAVESFVNGNNFADIDRVKRQIINLYMDDFIKIDSKGVVSSMYSSIPAQLASSSVRYSYTKATNKRKTTKTSDMLFALLDSKTVLPCYCSTDPQVSLSSTKNMNRYKLYLADTGLFVSLLFIDRPEASNEIYVKLLSNKLAANLGYLYENLVAQLIVASGNDLYYHTWNKTNSTHYYEVDFLKPNNTKIDAFEVKSSGVGKHESLKVFSKKYSKQTNRAIVLSQKDIYREGNIYFYPFYLAPFLFNDAVVKPKALNLC